MKKYNRLILILFFFSFSSSAMVIGDEENYNLELYGVVAMSAFTTGANEKMYDYNLDNESYIGFRGEKDMTENLSAIFQIESGYVGYEAENSGLGTFDTFVGLKGNWGKIRAGRMKSAMYEIIDWPYTNPGLGRVFDWGGDVKFYDSNRMSNMIRYDSPTLWGFNTVLSVNRNDISVSKSHTYSGRITYTSPWNTKIYLAAEKSTNRVIESEYNNDLTDTFGYIVGFEAPISDSGLTLRAAYKAGENEDTETKIVSSQDSISAIVEYWKNNYGAKLGYAKNFEYEEDGIIQEDTDDEVISLQLMAIIKDDFLPYFRIGKTDAYNAPEADWFYRLGLEFSF